MDTEIRTKYNTLRKGGKETDRHTERKEEYPLRRVTFRKLRINNAVTSGETLTTKASPIQRNL